jgi:hypothetical protein
MNIRGRYMYTRVVLGENIWFTVSESINEIVNKFNDDSSVFKANVIDGYEIAIVKDRVLCFVSVSITNELNIEPLDEVEA